MFAFVLFVAFAGVDSFDLIGVKEDVAKLKLEVAEIRADLVAIKARASAPIRDSLTTPVGLVAVTAAKEVGFHPVKAAVNVATAPARMLQRVCDGGQCRMVEVDVPVDTMSTYQSTSGDCSSGNCSGGSCGMQARRGWFGRRR